MFDIGWPELFLIAAITLVVVGPKEIPHVLRNVMGWVKKARSLAREFQSGVDDMVREADLEKLKENVVGGGEEALDFDKMLDPEGEAEKALDFEIPDLEADFKDELKDYSSDGTGSDTTASAGDELDVLHDYDDSTVAAASDDAPTENKT